MSDSDQLGYGRLACASNNRPYIVPLYFVFDVDRLCCFSTVGRNIEWIRENPLVCVEAEEVRPRRLGHRHCPWKICGNPEHKRICEEPGTVRSRLGKRSLWWQSGYTATQIRRKGTPLPVFYNIQIEEMSGLRGSPDTREAKKLRSSSNSL